MRQQTLPPLQKTQRQISWKAYGAALVVAALVFAAGIVIGLQYSQQITSDYQQRLDTLSSQTRDLGLLLQLAQQTNASQACSLYRLQVAKFGDQTAQFGDSVQQLEAARAGDASVLALKREYSSMELQDYLLTLQADGQCRQVTPTVLYFYSNGNCAECQAQGNELTALRAQKPEVKVYSFDVGADSFLTNSLVDALGITQYPSLFVRASAGNETLQGLQTNQKLLTLIYGNQ